MKDSDLKAVAGILDAIIVLATTAHGILEASYADSPSTEPEEESIPAKLRFLGDTEPPAA